MQNVSSIQQSDTARQLPNIYRQAVVCRRPANLMLEEIERFHGFPAPGVVIGAFMVDWAQEQIDSAIEYDAVVETYRCLPDAVQLFTPCTFGNGWMTVLDWDRFALTLYDRSTLRGVRVWLDAHKAGRFPNIFGWFFKRIPKHALPLDTLLDGIFEARRAMLSSRRVHVNGHLRRPKKTTVARCPACSEAYDPRSGDVCLGCREESYFQTV